MLALLLTKNIIIRDSNFVQENGTKTFKPAFALDTGAAIKGKNRADLFTGSGKKQRKIAGMLKKNCFYILLFLIVIKCQTMNGKSSKKVKPIKKSGVIKKSIAKKTFEKKSF